MSWALLALALIAALSGGLLVWLIGYAMEQHDRGRP